MNGIGFRRQLLAHTSRSIRRSPVRPRHTGELALLIRIGEQVAKPIAQHLGKPLGPRRVDQSNTELRLATGNQEFWVDGVLYFEDLGGQGTGAEPGVVFGAGSSGGRGSMKFHSVDFTIVPEPSAMILLGLGLVASLARSRKIR